MKQGRERRTAPRTQTRFLVRDIRHEAEESPARSAYCETSNISRNGAYCLSERPFPEFARIRVTLELCAPDSKQCEDLLCEGVVVRSDGKVVIEGQELHAFAVFFDRMSEDDRQKIDCYVEQHHIAKPEGAVRKGL